MPAALRVAVLGMAVGEAGVLESVWVLQRAHSQPVPMEPGDPMATVTDTLTAITAVRPITLARTPTTEVPTGIAVTTGPIGNELAEIPTWTEGSSRLDQIRGGFSHAVPKIYISCRAAAGSA